MNSATKTVYNKNLKQLNDKLKNYSRLFLTPLSTKNIRLDFIKYLQLDKDNLSIQDINFIEGIIPQIDNIKKLSPQEINLLEFLKKKHKEKNVIFNNDKKKNWVAYLNLDLDKLNMENVNLINNLCEKETLFPNKLDKVEIKELEKLVVKHTINMPISSTRMLSNNSIITNGITKTNNKQGLINSLLGFFGFNR